MTKKSEQAKYGFTSFLVLALYTGVLFFASCSDSKDQNPVLASTRKTLSAPKVTLLSGLAEKDKPKVILLDKVPKPAIVNLPVGDRIISAISKTSNGKKTQTDFTKQDSSFRTVVHETGGRGFFATITTDNGLSLDQVNCSYKDKWGNLWFGTNGGGVSRYDGKNFTTYTTAQGLGDNLVWCITQDHDGNLWFGTDRNGVSRYDGRSFTNFTTAQGLADDVVFSIVEDKKNNLWFGTLKGGVSKWNGKAFTNYSTKEGLAGNTVKTMLEDRKGSLWFGTLGGGVSKWDGAKFTNYTTEEGLNDNKVWSIAEDSSGSLWFGTEGKGLSEWDGKVFVNYDVLTEPSNDAIFCGTKDKWDNLWFGTRKSGVIKYDGNAFTRYSTTNGLANDQIRSITEDEKGNLWFGSFGSGVCKYAGNSFTNFTITQGLSSNVIYSIDEDQNGSLWLGTAGGVFHYNGNSFVNITRTYAIAPIDIYSVFKDHAGNLWFGTSGEGVTKFDGQHFTSYTTAQGLANNIVFSIAEDSKRNLWFGTSGGGVSRFDGKSFINYTTSQGLAGNDVFSIKEDREANLWFGTLGGGVSKFDGICFANYTTEQGLTDNVVWTIAEDRQRNLWFGTQHGLNQLSIEKRTNKKGGNSQQNLFGSFTAEDGLPNDFITQVVQGVDEKLYIGTNLGICELLPAKSQANTGKGWTVGRVFNTRNGYPVKDVNAGLNAMYKDTKGIIWIATGSDKTGLVRFEPKALVGSSDLPPQVFINQIKINNEALSWRSISPSLNKEDTMVSNRQAIITDEISTYGKTLTDAERDLMRNKFANVKFDSVSNWQALPQKLVLPYYFNDVSFNFGATETSKNFLVKYKYFLEGYDKDWSPAIHNTYVNFGNIYEGHYTFKVKAQSPEGIWSEPVSYEFTVLPPLWRTWWMFAVYVVLILASVYGFVRWKHTQILRQKKILKHKVKVATRLVREEAEKVQRQKRKIEDTLSELKEAQAQLIQREKMAFLGELTAGIAHEIQNPLNFVNNFSEVNKELLIELKEETDKNNTKEIKAIADDVIRNLEKISDHGKRADNIVKGMLQHSRQGLGIKEPTDINALCEECFRLSYHSMRTKDNNFYADLKTSFDESIGKIVVVPQDMARVLLNLFNNALYAVNAKAKLSGKSYQPLVIVSTKKANGKVEISIRDNGNGIAQNIVHKIYQPFFTTKPSGEGTGLGLSLSYDIITKGHGGVLKVNTKEGEFAEFIVELPCQPD